MKDIGLKVPRTKNNGKDLNDSSKLNANASFSTKYNIPPVRNGTLIKGANGVIKIYKQEYSNEENQSGLAQNTENLLNSLKGNHSNSYLFNQTDNRQKITTQFTWAKNNWITFWNTYNLILQQGIELFKYENLPTGLDKYKIETILNNNGLVGILNIDNLYIAVTVFNSYNEKTLQEKEAMEHYKFFSAARPNFVKIIGDFPEIIRPIIKTKKNKFLVDKDIFVIRNDLYQHSTLILVARYLQDWLDILNQIELNINKALPKALYITNSAANLQESALKQTLNNFAESSDSFQPIILEQSLLDKMTSLGLRTPYIPIQFTDVTTMLKTLNDYFENKIKEIMGHKTLRVSDKQQRLVTQEIETASTLSDFNLEHKINIRNLDFEVLNKVKNLKIKVSKNKIDSKITLQNQDKETINLKTKGGN